MDKRVSILPCPDYEPASCRSALEAGVAAIGGLSWVKPGMRVGIKTNLVAGMAPEKAATTHPALLRSLSELLLEAGAGEVIIGDSPGGLYTVAALERVYKAAGLTAIETGRVRLNRDISVAEVKLPGARRIKTATVTGWLLHCDAVVNFCKLKTHGMMGLSAACKNLFGTIPGTMKPEYHYRFPVQTDFAHMLVDLNEFWQTKLNVVDGVLAMEGNGPTAGSPKPMGLVAMSADPHGLDLLMANIIGLDPKSVPTLTAAMERELVPDHVEQLEILGDWQGFRAPDFRLVAGRKSLRFDTVGGKRIGPLFAKAASKALAARPQVEKKDCIGCQKCRKVCPAKAITMARQRPVIDRKRCIRCFCCQEFCPVGAMKVHRTPLARLLTGSQKES